MPERRNEGGGGEGVVRPEKTPELMMRLKDLDPESDEARAIIAELNERAKDFRREPAAVTEPASEEKDDRPWWARQNE